MNNWLRLANAWSIGIYGGDSPLRLRTIANVRNPVLGAKDVTDVFATGVADPFLVFHDDKWFLLFEVVNGINGRGEIGYATSDDGCRWDYRGIVLREPFHLSYPCVIRWASRYYLVPESYQANAIRLYEAADFPVRWKLVRELLAGSRFIDPSLFAFDGTWWMYVKDTHGRRPVLRLFHSETPLGAWREHPASPVVSDDWGRVRPGGRVVVTDGRIIRFAQDCRQRYGKALRAFEVTQLTHTDYAEREVALSAELGAQGTGWNAEAVHHVDAVRRPDGRWLAAVDGCRSVPKALVRLRRWRWRRKNYDHRVGVR